MSGYVGCNTLGQISGTIFMHGWFQTSKGIAVDLFPQKAGQFLLPVLHWLELLTCATQLLVTYAVDMLELPNT